MGDKQDKEATSTTEMRLDKMQMAPGTGYSPNGTHPGATIALEFSSARHWPHDIMEYHNGMP